MKVIAIEASAEERAVLEEWSKGVVVNRRLAERARIILDALAGVKAMETARRIGVYPYVVTKWRKRFQVQRIKGLYDGARSGKPATYGAETEAQVLSVLNEAPPEGRATWNGRLIAEHLGNVSPDYVWRVMRKHDIVLQRCTKDFTKGRSGKK